LVLVFNPVISANLKLLNEFGTSGHYYAAIVEHVNDIGLDIVEQSLIVRDDDA
jgi:hypothetical protein